MSNKHKPAFPVSAKDRENYEAGGYIPDGVFGLTKREYFAGLAMQGLCADPSYRVLISSAEHAAQNAVAIADAILAELERSE